MIMRGEFRSLHMGVAAMVFASSNTARDALDELCSMTPAFVEYFDAELFETAAKCGRQYEFYKRALDEIKAPASVVIVGFDEFSDRVRAKRLKKLLKHLPSMKMSYFQPPTVMRRRICSLHSTLPTIQPCLGAE